MPLSELNNKIGNFTFVIGRASVINYVINIFKNKWHVKHYVKTIEVLRPFTKTFTTNYKNDISHYLITVIRSQNLFLDNYY